ncbi:hypothetical protein Ddc_07523 [Ditylenchus destructor]|nr:hypothetical protein Ddc_07523 [Ditylenchus destructor]
MRPQSPTGASAWTNFYATFIVAFEFFFTINSVNAARPAANALRNVNKLQKYLVPIPYTGLHHQSYYIEKIRKRFQIEDSMAPYSDQFRHSPFYYMDNDYADDSNTVETQKTTKPHVGSAAKPRSIPLIEAPVVISNPFWSILSRAGGLYRIFRRRSSDDNNGLV